MNVPVLSERLRSERERLGLSQGACADACGVTSRSQRNYELGERLPDAAYLARAISVGVDVLYVLSGVRANRALTPDLEPKEQVILDAFRSGTEEQQEFIMKAALGFSGTEVPDKARGAPQVQKIRDNSGIMIVGSGTITAAGRKGKK